MAIGAFFPAGQSDVSVTSTDTQTITTTDTLAVGDWILVFQSGEASGSSFNTTMRAPLPVSYEGGTVTDVGGTHPTSHTIQNLQGGSLSDTGWIDLGYTAHGYVGSGTPLSIGSPGRNHTGVWGKLLTTDDDGTVGGAAGPFTVQIDVDSTPNSGRHLTTTMLVVTGSTGGGNRPRGRW